MALFRVENEGCHIATVEADTAAEALSRVLAEEITLNVTGDFGGQEDEPPFRDHAHTDWHCWNATLVAPRAVDE